MEKLQQYSSKEQHFIILQGLDIYEKHKVFLQLHEDNTTCHYNDEAKQILQGEIKSFLTEQHGEKQKHYEEWIHMLKAQIEKHEKDISLYREEHRNMQQQMQEEIERRTKERTNMLQLKATTLEERIKQVQEQHEKDKSRVHELEKRYELVSKGLEFEKTIYDNLVALNDTFYNNIWEIVHVGQTFGGKGDIILKHKESDISIMIDPKNHDNVNKQHKDKFLNDMRNELNNFKAGIMVSRGKIRGKKSYEEIEDGSRKLIYISHFKLGQEDFLMTLLEHIHHQCVGKEDDAINMKQMKDKYIQEYKKIKKQKDICETQLSYFREREKQITGEYHDYFGEDILLQTSQHTSSSTSSSSISTTDMNSYMIDYFQHHLRPEKGKDHKVKVQCIYQIIQEAFPSITSTKFIRTLNQWKKMQPNDNGKKCALRGYIEDYIFDIQEKAIQKKLEQQSSISDKMDIESSLVHTSSTSSKSQTIIHVEM